MSKELKKIEQGKCPSCGSADLDYSGTEVYDNDREYDYECRACGFYGAELFSEIFQGHQIHDKETGDDVLHEVTPDPLIAAAPDLLAVCKELTSLIHIANSQQHAGLDVQPMDWAAMYQATNKAKAIIAKATT